MLQKTAHLTTALRSLLKSVPSAFAPLYFFLLFVTHLNKRWQKNLVLPAACVLPHVSSSCTLAPSAVLNHLAFLLGPPILHTLGLNSWPLLGDDISSPLHCLSHLSQSLSKPTVAHISYFSLSFGHNTLIRALKHTEMWFAWKALFKTKLVPNPCSIAATFEGGKLFRALTSRHYFLKHSKPHSSTLF